MSHMPAPAAPTHGEQDLHTDFAFSPDGKTIAIVSFGDPEIVRLWNARTLQLRASFMYGQSSTGKDKVPGAIAFSPDSSIVAVTSQTDGTVMLWNTRTHKRLGVLAGPAEAVFDVAFSPDGTTVATAGGDGAAQLWDVKTRTQRGRLTGDEGAMNAVAFSNDGTTLATATERHVRLWSNAIWSGADELRSIVCRQLVGWPSRNEWEQYAPGIPYRRDCR